jgi:hypothetical protein
MNFLKAAGQMASAAAKSAAESAKKTYAELKAPPSKVRCVNCPTEIDVPPTVWDWTCAAGHVNKREQDLCAECKVAQPANLPEPTVTCPSCQAVTPVPSSNAKKHAREAAVKTKEAVVATAASAKAAVEHARAAPTTFHCAHCNTLLAVPTGPWACQTCTTENLEEAKACKQCGQKKTDQKAICGVCRQSTVIPATNFADSLKHAAKDLKKSTQKVYYDVSGKPYLTCQKCQAHVAVDKSKVEAASPNAAAAAAVEGGAGAEGGKGSAPPPAQAEGSYNGEPVICTNCKNPIGQ